MSATQPHILLDSIAGWRAEFTAVSSSEVGSLRIDSLPGRAEDIQLPFGCPGAFAIDTCEHELFWTDDLDNRIRHTVLAPLRDTAKDPHIQSLPGVGGAGRGARRLQKPRGIAVLQDGSIAVADTGNDRLQVFGPEPYPLVVVINGLNHPWGIAADPCGYLHVVDRGNRRVQRYFRDGANGTTILDGLNSPTDIKRSQDGTFALLDGDIVVVFRDGAARRLAPIPDAAALAFDATSNLFVGAGSLIFKFIPESKGSLQYRSAGAGVTGREFAIQHMIWTKQHDLLVAGKVTCAPRPRLWRVDTNGASVTEGMVVTEPLDSGREECRWDRVELRGDIPEGCAIDVEAQTSESDLWSQRASPFEAISKLKLAGKQLDSLVQSPPGRYLRLKLKLSGNGITSPRLDAILIRFPRDSYLKYLPAIYQEDPESRWFLDRFLSIFQTSFDSFDTTIDNVSRLFDPLAVDAKHFAWLAGWLAMPLNPHWTDIERRTALKNAWELYQLRGTPRGVERLVKLYTGADTSIVEHFHMRPLMLLGGTRGKRLGQTSRLWSRDIYARLQLDAYSRLGYFRLTGTPEPALEPLAWGAHRFSVFFSAEPTTAGDTLKQVRQIVEREKPAHTEAVYCPILPRMRVGLQSTVGVDTRIGMITNIVLGKVATLGYDAVLACSTHEQSLHAAGASLHSRAGLSTRLQ